MTGNIVLYSAVEQMLTRYDVDVTAATLTRCSAIMLPGKVQYAWPHPTGSLLYVTSSAAGPHVRSDINHVSALVMTPEGDLRFHGEPTPLPFRAVHLCVDPEAQYVVNAHNFQRGRVTVHRLAPDGSVGAEVMQKTSLELGTFPHQVRIFPSGCTVIIADRGNNAKSGKPEDPGALRTFLFKNGVLSAAQVVAPGRGFGFGPRHVDFHPSKPWIYVSDERTNRLTMFRFVDDRLDAESSYTRTTLANPGDVRPRQLAGAIHVHPNGRFVYVMNRADHTIEYGDRKVFSGGENNIAVFSLDQATGEPTLVQHADTHSFHVRTFSCDPSGQLLVTASIKALDVQEQGRVNTVNAALTMFRIGADGSLQFVRKYDVETEGSQLQYWMGMVEPG